MSVDLDKLEKRIDRTVLAPVEINASIGGFSLETMGEVMEFAKLMATAGPAIPKYMRGEPGACMAICVRALRWGMDPFFVAEKSYMVNNKGEERIAFESQLVHAVIEARAPIKNRLRSEIIGEGMQRKCRVWGTFIGEDKPHEFISETLESRIKAIGRNEYGKVKGSPLWDTKPDLQLFYDASRDWAREHCPEVLGGVYTLDELPDAEPVDVTPKVDSLAQRLRDTKAQRAGKQNFDHNRIVEEAQRAGQTVIDGVAEGDAKPGEGVTDHDGSDEPDDRVQDRGAGNPDDHPQRNDDGTSGSGGNDTSVGKADDVASGADEKAQAQGNLGLGQDAAGSKRRK